MNKFMGLLCLAEVAFLESGNRRYWMGMGSGKRERECDSKKEQKDKR